MLVFESITWHTLWLATAFVYHGSGSHTLLTVCIFMRFMTFSCICSYKRFRFKAALHWCSTLARFTYNCFSSGCMIILWHLVDKLIVVPIWISSVFLNALDRHSGLETQFTLQTHRLSCFLTFSFLSFSLQLCSWNKLLIARWTNTQHQSWGNSKGPKTIQGSKCLKISWYCLVRIPTCAAYDLHTSAFSFYCINFSVVCFKHAIPLGIEYTLHKVTKGYKEVLITLWGLLEIPIPSLLESEIW